MQKCMQISWKHPPWGQKGQHEFECLASQELVMGSKVHFSLGLFFFVGMEGMFWCG
jgi:hypothetical protein